MCLSSLWSGFSSCNMQYAFHLSHMCEECFQFDSTKYLPKYHTKNGWPLLKRTVWNWQNYSVLIYSVLFTAALDNPLAISREMEKQITSNNIRIAMLEAQNKKLRHSIEKLSEIQEDVKPLRQVKIRCFSPLRVGFDSWNIQLSDNFTSCFHMFPYWLHRTPQVSPCFHLASFTLLV